VGFEQNCRGWRAREWTLAGGKLMRIDREMANALVGD
jgi:hypothetical protein